MVSTHSVPKGNHSFDLFSWAHRRQSDDAADALGQAGRQNWPEQSPDGVSDPL